MLPYFVVFCFDFVKVCALDWASSACNAWSAFWATPWASANFSSNLKCYMRGTSGVYFLSLFAIWNVNHIKFQWNILNDVSNCVKLDNTISKYDTTTVFGVKIKIFGFGVFGEFFFFVTFVSKTISLRHVSNKVPSAKWPHKPWESFMFLVKDRIYDWICH